MVFDLYINRECKDNQKQADQYVSVSACKGFFIVMGVFGHGWGFEKFVNHELTESIFLTRFCQKLELELIFILFHKNGYQ